VSEAARVSPPFLYPYPFVGGVPRSLTGWRGLRHRLGGAPAASSAVHDCLDWPLCRGHPCGPPHGDAQHPDECLSKPGARHLQIAAWRTGSGWRRCCRGAGSFLGAPQARCAHHAPSSPRNTNKTMREKYKRNPITYHMAISSLTTPALPPTLHRMWHLHGSSGSVSSVLYEALTLVRAQRHQRRESAHLAVAGYPLQVEAYPPPPTLTRLPPPPPPALLPARRAWHRCTAR